MEEHRKWIKQVNNMNMTVKITPFIKEGDDEMVYQIETKPQNFIVKRTIGY